MTILVIVLWSSPWRSFEDLGLKSRRQRIEKNKKDSEPEKLTICHNFKPAVVPMRYYY
jgi:hypothetical protein